MARAVEIAEGLVSCPKSNKFCSHLQRPNASCYSTGLSENPVKKYMIFIGIELTS